MFGNVDWFNPLQARNRDMPEAKLTLSIPDRAWPGEITRAYPEACVRIVAAISQAESGVGLAEISGPDLDALLDDMMEHPAVQSMEILQHGDGESLVQFETQLPLLLFAARDSGLPLEMPFEIVDGEATWNLTTSQDAISALGDQLSAMGISYSVDFIQQKITNADDLLTDRQQVLVAEAVSRGYYDTPRRCTLTELADAVDLAKSTTSETLHRAEERVMKEFAATALDDVVESLAESP